ncbi:MAG TPA: HD-GYP domain-containing protein [Terriglobales bacterium]|nr:HD-GYP domain-containing protein [Terriglobales bacterium]
MSAHMPNSQGLLRRIEELEQETRRLRQKLLEAESSYDVTLETLADALDCKQGQTENHSRRVTAFAIAIARQVGIERDSEEMRVLARGAFLHDIGKMTVPEAILRKPGALTPEEMEIVRDHPFRGYSMIKLIPVLQEPAEIVYAHHERFDGTGYPRGLRGKEIPLGARITALANTLDAITSDLPYRGAQSLEAARAEIENGSGGQFDPEVVTAFLGIAPSRWQGLREQIEKQAALRVGSPGRGGAHAGAGS